jgi:hypothetical protein
MLHGGMILQKADAKEHSYGDIGDASAAAVVQQSQGMTKDLPLKWGSAISFKDIATFPSSAGSFNNPPVGIDEQDYFLQFIDCNFYDFIAVESDKYGAQRQ